MLESNPPRNSRSQTHQDDEMLRGEAAEGFALSAHQEPIGLIDLPMPQKTHNEALRLPRLLVAPAALTGGKAGGGC
jgi:hypothetical protein